VGLKVGSIFSVAKWRKKLRRGREYFIFYERSEIKNLVICDQVRPSAQRKSAISGFLYYRKFNICNSILGRRELGKKFFNNNFNFIAVGA